MTVEERESYRFLCDVCRSAATGPARDIPPPGFAIVSIRLGPGPGVVAHLCVAGPCLDIGIANLVEGKMPDGSALPD